MTDSLSQGTKSNEGKSIQKSMRFSINDQANLEDVKAYLKKKSPFNEETNDTEAVRFALQKTAALIRTGELE